MLKLQINFISPEFFLPNISKNEEALICRLLEQSYCAQHGCHWKGISTTKREMYTIRAKLDIEGSVHSSCAQWGTLPNSSTPSHICNKHMSLLYIFFVCVLCFPHPETLTLRTSIGILSTMCYGTPCWRC